MKNGIDFFIEFSPKIDEKSSPEVRKTLFARKIDKITLPGTPFLAKDRFLVDFWVPEGTPKIAKNLRPLRREWALDAILSPICAVAWLFCIFAQFWVHSGRLLGQFWINFRISLRFVGVRLPFSLSWVFLGVFGLCGWVGGLVLLVVLVFLVAQPPTNQTRRPGGMREAIK